MREDARLSVRSRQGGAATTELIVAMLAALPIFILLPMLGKLQDIAQAAQQGARYAAFESAVRGGSSAHAASDAVLASEVRRRLMGASLAPVKTGDVAGDVAAHRNLFWVTHKGTPILQRFDEDVKLSMKRDSRRMGLFLVDQLAGQLDLPDETLVTASVQVTPQLADFGEPFSAVPIVVTRKVALLTDTWAATDPAMVRDRVMNSVAVYPYQFIKVAGKAASIFTTPPAVPGSLFKEPKPDFGNVYPDVVPADRLK